MKKFAKHTLQQYLERLSERAPVPGGGSAAALSSALGAALLEMVARYSQGKGLSACDEKRLSALIRQIQALRQRLLVLVDLDSEVYLGVVKTRKGNAKIKRAALKKAQKVPLEIARLSLRSVELSPFLVVKGNRHLLSDVQVAMELLLAGYRGAMINVEIDQ